MTQQTFQINGRIIDRNPKKGVPDLQIEAWDKDLIFDDLVGSAITDAEGYFQIKFTETHDRECFLDRQLRIVANLPVVILDEVLAS